MAHQALDVAHLILELDPIERQMTRLRLLKLTYIAHGLFLGQYHRRLVREDVEAWKHGPVIHSIYTHFIDYSDGRIIPAKEKATSYPWLSDNKQVLEDNAGKFIEKVVHRYAHQTGRDMSALTHQNGTPWYKTIFPFAKAGFENLPQHLVIPADYIADYYIKLFERHEGTLEE